MLIPDVHRQEGTILISQLRYLNKDFQSRTYFP